MQQLVDGEGESAEDEIAELGNSHCWPKIIMHFMSSAEQDLTFNLASTDKSFGLEGRVCTYTLGRALNFGQ